MQPVGWDVASGLESRNQRAGVRESETESSERAVGVSALCLKGAGRCAARAGDETLPEPLVTEAGSVFPVVVVQHFFSSCAVQGDGAAPLLTTGKGTGRVITNRRVRYHPLAKNNPSDPVGEKLKNRITLPAEKRTEQTSFCEICLIKM